MKDIIDSEPRRHRPALVLDDDCHVVSASRVTPRRHWRRLENGTPRDAAYALDLLDELGARAAFLSSGWRLLSTRRLSSICRRWLHRKLASHTGCVRVHLASAVKSMPVRWEGVFGTRRILGQLEMNGRGVVECPAAMAVGLLGHSKPSNLKTIRGQIAFACPSYGLSLRSLGIFATDLRLWNGSRY